MFRRLFGKKKYHLNDLDFGEIESFSSKGNEVGWTIKYDYIDPQIEILISGDQEQIDPELKETLMKVLSNEQHHREQSESELKSQYENAELEFLSLSEHFQLKGITVHHWGYELIFQQKDEPFYFFRVIFEDGVPSGVAIDG